MSKLILNKLKALKPLIKTNATPYERYGVVKDGILYFGNGFVQAEINIDIPFNCCIDLYQLITILQSIKGESVIVNREGKVLVHYNDTDYNIETLPLDSLDNTINYFNATINVECDKPQIFKQMSLIAEQYIRVITNKQNINFLDEVMFVHNNNIIFTDKFNVYQAQLDFGMPTLALPLSAIIYFNKIAKNCDIIGMGVVNNHLLVEFDNGLKLYLPDLFPDNATLVLHDYARIEQVLNKVWEQPNIFIPDFIKKQIMLVNKISLQNVICFTNSFCQAHNSQINYPSFTDEMFNFKCLYRHLKIVLELGSTFKICEKGMCFLSEDNRIRGFIGRTLEDEIR